MKLLLKYLHPKQIQNFLDLTEQEKKVSSLDTGNPQEDEKRKTILTLFLELIKNTLKTNYFDKDKKALSFRFQPQFLKEIKDLKEKFPKFLSGFFS